MKQSNLASAALHLQICSNFWSKNAGGGGGGGQVHLGEGLAQLFKPPSNTNVHPPIYKTKSPNELQ